MCSNCPANLLTTLRVPKFLQLLSISLQIKIYWFGDRSVIFMSLLLADFLNVLNIVLLFRTGTVTNFYFVFLWFWVSLGENVWSFWSSVQGLAQTSLLFLVHFESLLVNINTLKVILHCQTILFISWQLLYYQITFPFSAIWGYRSSKTSSVSYTF